MIDFVLLHASVSRPNEYLSYESLGGSCILFFTIGVYVLVQLAPPDPGVVTFSAPSGIVLWYAVHVRDFPSPFSDQIVWRVLLFGNPALFPTEGRRQCLGAPSSDSGNLSVFHRVRSGGRGRHPVFASASPPSDYREDTAFDAPMSTG